jgi:hypothetical protein
VLELWEHEKEQIYIFGDNFKYVDVNARCCHDKVCCKLDSGR